MNERKLARMTGRIPALLGHIARAKAKKQPKRVKGFEQEYERRMLECELEAMKGRLSAGDFSKIKAAIKSKKAELAKAA